MGNPRHVEAVATGIHPEVGGVDSAVPDGDLPRSYRTREQSIVVGISGLIGSSFLTLMGMAVTVAPGGLLVGAVMALAGVIGYVLTFRAVRAGIRLDERGVVIMNLLRSTTIPWTGVEYFSVGAHGVWPRVGIAHLRDGSTLAIWGIQGPNPAIRPKNHSAERIIEALNHTLGARAAGPASEHDR